ncbi:helix-turn-helix domain-containing protein [Paenibacillus sp.]|uniref:helix-turn-helix domain-containing protein n=1 Tax=Paenibacillus sp. TaxID=58172 RepID=UPI002D34345D|nr:helix-turn-helix domain-containing protein [Paenibacillus sp.]HZG88098.1 helix-turn-helix domain-containing protein [Paenibacillus sp.]
MKVLIVDDDKLVRQGLISVMPWSEFGMEVVGEANNGEKALEFLERHEVDLMLTDLAMPVMSGIELMRIAKKRYPGLHTVVLTLHQDFEYVQEALRLGAIDYIAKVELETDSFRNVLGRVHARIQEQAGWHDGRADGRLLGDAACVLVAFGDAAAADAALAELPESLQEPDELEAGIWLWTDDAAVWSGGKPAPELEAWITRTGNRALLRVAGTAGRSVAELRRAVRLFKDQRLFYEYRPEQAAIELDWPTLSTAPSASAAEEEVAALHERWLSLEWIQDEAAFKRLADDTKAARLLSPRIVSLLYMIESEWQRIFAHVTERRLPAPTVVDVWYEAEQWLCGLRALTADTTQNGSLSSEVQSAVLKAVHIVHTEWDQPLHAADVARRVNVSRSYFSECFKAMTGKSFNEYLRSVRMEKAKEYLLHTNKPVQWVAERSGYLDEKYFSRLFREYTGLLPSEFRAQRG